MNSNTYKTRFPGAGKLQKNSGISLFSSNSLRFFLLAVGILTLLVSGWSMLAAPPSSPAINLDQASNGGIGKTPITPVGWENGNQNGQKAHYNEGESIPYRARVTGLTAGQTYRATFGYDITHSGKHAIDYVTGNQRIAEMVKPCQIESTVAINPSVAGASNTSGTGSIIPAPTGDPAAGIQLKDIANGSYNNVVTLEGTQRVFIFNGEISAVQFMTEGDPSLSQSETSFRVTFTASSPTVVLSWGGHIARAFDWGSGNSATGISGSPFHTRAKSLDVPAPGGGFNAVSIGSQDRALASSAVQPPSGCTVTGDSSVCSGATNHHELIGPTESGINYSWSVSPNTVVISSQNTDPNASTPYGVGKIYANVLASAAYTITLTKSNGAGSSTCPLAVTLKTNTSATNLSPQVKCPGDTASFTTTASGDGPFTFVWKHGSTVLSNGGRISIVTSGATSTLSISNVDASDAVDPSYSVEATGACSTATKSTTLTVNATATLSDPSDLALCAGATATFNTTAAGTPPAGGFVFVWKKGATTISNGGKYTITNGATTSSLQITDIDSNDASSYTVSTSGACNNPSQSATLTINPNPDAAALADAAAKCQVALGTAFSLDGTASNGTPSWSIVSQDAGITNVAFGNAALADTSVTLTGVGSATLRLTVASESCGSDTADVTVTVNRNPTVSIEATDACATSATLTATVSNGTGPITYVWTKDGQPFATHSNIAGNTDAISVNATGVYLVTVTDANSCSGARSGQVCFTFTLGSAAMINPDASITPSYALQAKPEDASMFYAYLATVITMFVV
jgi:hypothetical protein